MKNLGYRLRESIKTQAVSLVIPKNKHTSQEKAVPIFFSQQPSDKILAWRLLECFTAVG
jgi:hypothetical protein